MSRSDRTDDTHTPTDLAWFDVNKSGEIANRLSTDVHEVAEHLVEVRASYDGTCPSNPIFASPRLSRRALHLPLFSIPEHDLYHANRT